MTEKKDEKANERRTYSVRLRPDVMKKIKLMAVEEEKPLSALLEEAIDDLINKYGKERKGKGSN